MTPSIQMRGGEDQRKAVRSFDWTPERVAFLRRAYLELALMPGQIAFRLGTHRWVVSGKIARLGLAAERPEWLVSEHKRRATEASHAKRRAKAAAAGRFTWTEAKIKTLRARYVDEDAPCAVIAKELGASAVEVRRKAKQEGFTALRKAKGVSRQRVRRIEPSGSVIRLPDGRAAGLSGWESALHTAAAPRPEGDKDAIARARGSRKSSFANAGRARKAA